MGFVWLYNRNVVGHFEGIPLVSFVDDSAAYVRVSTDALRLIRDHDPRRFRRVLNQTRWLVDSALSSGPYSGAYQHGIKATQLDFELDRSHGDEKSHAAYFAGLIVHEATHGLIRDKGISTKPENRIQVERICCAEQNRFLELLMRSFPDLPAKLIRPFDPRKWDESWNSGRLRKACKELARIDQKHGREAGTSNGG